MVARSWISPVARGFKSRRTHVNGQENETEKGGPVVLVEDGQRFLSREELDRYREQKVMLAWEAGAYA